MEKERGGWRSFRVVRWVRTKPHKALMLTLRRSSQESLQASWYLPVVMQYWVGHCPALFSSCCRMLCSCHSLAGRRINLEVEIICQYELVLLWISISYTREESSEIFPRQGLLTHPSLHLFHDPVGRPAHRLENETKIANFNSATLLATVKRQQ